MKKYFFYLFQKFKLQTLLSIIIFGFGITEAWPQQQENNLSIVSGQVLSKSDNSPLPYTTIYIIKNQKGAISNENGFFSLNISGLLPSDSVRFQYVGFQEKKFAISQLLTNPDVILTEKINILGELLVFGRPPDADFIIKKVLENKEKNYNIRPIQENIFIRERNNQNINKIEINYKKSSINKVDEKLFKEIENKVPKQMTWYTDFLGHAYQNNSKDETKFKLSPERVVALKQDDLTDMANIEKIFADLARNTKEEEYWKIKTGIISTKIDLDIEDTTTENSGENRQKLNYFVQNIKSQYKFTNFINEDYWEFLHSPRKYNFNLIGGSRFNGENVYIIDFEPKKKRYF